MTKSKMTADSNLEMKRGESPSLNDREGATNEKIFARIPGKKLEGQSGHSEVLLINQPYYLW